MNNVMLPTTPNNVRTNRPSVMLRRHSTRQSTPQVTVRVDCCAWRREAIGWVHCSCSSKPSIYACDCPAVAGGRCLLHAVTKRVKALHWNDGTNTTFASRQRLNDVLPICATCQHRTANAAAVIPAGQLRFFRTADLYQRTLELLQLLPEIGGVIAIPRSGMLPASIIATARHVPLFTLQGGHLQDVGAGFRSHSFASSQAPSLLIDDTTWSGRQMSAAVAALRGRPLIRAAVFAHEARHVDYCAAVVEGDFVVEWNLFNNPGLLRGHSAIAACRGGIALDFDGVICEEPRINDHADLAGHLHWLETARPLHLPLASAVKLICSGRLEGWRPATERWLERHHVRCDRLSLDPARTVEERDLFPRVATRKGEEFRDSDCTLFVESDPRQCPVIRDMSRKTVICLPTGEVFQ